MRQLADSARIHAFIRALGQSATAPGRVYLTGGATAVVLGWRAATIDVDVKLVPDQDALLRAIPALKESLELNVELASPDDFIPVRAGWEERSRFIVQAGPLAFYHFDFAAQALAKLERAHAQDLQDVREMLNRGLVDADALRREFAAIEPLLYRYPAVDAAAFARSVSRWTSELLP
jgi:uncharacterized nucleotidyltransferase DUF6036